MIGLVPLLLAAELLAPTFGAANQSHSLTLACGDTPASVRVVNTRTEAQWPAAWAAKVVVWSQDTDPDQFAPPAPLGFRQVGVLPGHRSVTIRWNDADVVTLDLAECEPVPTTTTVAPTTAPTPTTTTAPTAPTTTGPAAPPTTAAPTVTTQPAAPVTPPAPAPTSTAAPAPLLDGGQALVSRPRTDLPATGGSLDLAIAGLFGVVLGGIALLSGRRHGRRGRSTPMAGVEQLASSAHRVLGEVLASEEVR